MKTPVTNYFIFMVEIGVFCVDVLFINGINSLVLSTLLAHDFEWVDLFAIALRALEFFFQVDSETLEM